MTHFFAQHLSYETYEGWSLTWSDDNVNDIGLHPDRTKTAIISGRNMETSIVGLFNRHLQKEMHSHRMRKNVPRHGFFREKRRSRIETTEFNLLSLGTNFDDIFII
jgi:hypothetical protein